MASKDLARTIKPVQTLAPAARTASANGAGVDTKGYSAAAVIFEPGTLTDGVHTPKVQESDDNAAWNDVAAADQVGSLAALASNTLQWVGYRGVKRYLRAVVTVTGGPATGLVCGATVVLGSPAKAPTA